MEARIPVFDYDNCIACAICVAACPDSTLEMNKTGIDPYNKAYPALTDRHCTGCSLCARNCPMGAITMQTLTYATAAVEAGK